MEMGYMQTLPEGRRKYIMSYNALRGFAAAGIFFSHMSFLGKSDMAFWRELYRFFMSPGSYCSSFFYILSGFLAVFTWKDISFQKYMSGKMKKIYPLALAVLLLAIGVDAVMGGSETVSGSISVGSREWWFNILMGIIMLKAFIPVESTFYSFHGPSWYLSALVVFYVLAWFIVPRLVGNGEQERQEKNQTIIAVIYICVCAYVMQAALCFIVDWKCSGGGIWLWLTYVNPYFRIFGECFLGMIVALYADKSRLASSSGNLAKTAALLFALLALLASNRNSSSIWKAWIHSFPNVLLLLAFYNDKGKIADILHTKPCQFLGNISFELYMTHAFVYEGIPIAAGILSGRWQGWIVSHAGTRFVITMVLAVLFAWMVHMVLALVGKKAAEF